MPAVQVRRARAILLVSEGNSLAETGRMVGMGRPIVRVWGTRLTTKPIEGLNDKPGRGRKPSFSPEVAVYQVKLTCEMPDQLGRSLSLWDCTDLAQKLSQTALLTPSRQKP